MALIGEISRVRCGPFALLFRTLWWSCGARLPPLELRADLCIGRGVRRGIVVIVIIVVVVIVSHRSLASSSSRRRRSCANIVVVLVVARRWGMNLLGHIRFSLSIAVVCVRPSCGLSGFRDGR